MTDDEGATNGRPDPVRVLFVCTGNSARSLMAEALLRARGGARVTAASGGTRPAGVNPLTLRALTAAGIPTDGLRSKPVAEHLAGEFDYVITVCDSARDTCPVVPGARSTLHWSLEDPAAVVGTDDERLGAFRLVLGDLDRRVGQFLRTAVP